MDKCFERQDVVDGLAAANHRDPAILHHDFGRQGTPVVVRRHHRSVRAGIEDGEEIADLRSREPPIFPQRVAALAERADDIREHLRALARFHGLDAMVGVIEHRPDEFRHPRIENHEELATWLHLDVDDPCQQRARRPDDAPAGFEDDRQAGAADDRQHGLGVFLRGRRDRAVVRDTEAAAEIEVLDRQAVSDEPVGELDDRAGSAPQRLEIHDLRADVRVEADDLDAGAIAHSPAQVARFVDRHAELVGLEAGRNVRMAARVDIRVDADGDAGARLTLARDRVDPFELALRLRVDRLDAQVDGLRQLGAGLADAGEDDLGRDEPGAQRDVDLPAGVGVDLAPERPQQPDDRERRVGLERVMHRVRIRRERIVNGAVP